MLYPGAQGKVVPLSAIAHYEPSLLAGVNHQVNIPRHHFLHLPRCCPQRRFHSHPCHEQKIGIPNTFTACFPHSSGLSIFLATELFSLSPLSCRLYRLGILYESYIHRSRYFTLPPRDRRRACAHDLYKDLSIIALIGVILLIGIARRTHPDDRLCAGCGTIDGKSL